MEHNTTMVTSDKRMVNLGVIIAKKLGQTRDICWKIHGKTTYWKPSRPLINKESRGFHVSFDKSTTTTKLSPFNKK